MHKSSRRAGAIALHLQGLDQGTYAIGQFSRQSMLFLTHHWRSCDPIDSFSRGEGFHSSAAPPGALQPFPNAFSARTICTAIRSMAPNLSLSQHHQIRDMILSNSLTGVQIASVAGCSPRSIRSIQTNLGCFGTTKAPANGLDARRASRLPCYVHYATD